MNIMEAIEEIGRTKDIDAETVIMAAEEAFAAAARKFYRDSETFVAKMNRKTGAIEVFAKKIAAEKVDDPHIEVSLEEARTVKPDAQPGDVILYPRAAEGFGRIAAQTAKQVIYQRVREAERTTVFERYHNEIGKILNGVVRRVEFGNVIVTVGKTEALLPKRFQVRGESYAPGDRIRAIIVEVDPQSKGSPIILSRSDTRLVQCLFEIEVPEIQENVVRIRGIAREPGDRSKVAVETTDPDVDPVGACVGMKGYRVQNIIRELGGEKVDIIPYSSDLATYVRNALAPARIGRMAIVDRDAKRLEAVVAGDQLSLAIGRGGQNVRLASQLVGWHIDIKSDDVKRRESPVRAATGGADDLTELPGVGEAMAKQLADAGLTTFAAIAASNVEALTAVPGIGKKTAEKLLQAASEAVAVRANAAAGHREAAPAEMNASVADASAAEGAPSTFEDVKTPEAEESEPPVATIRIYDLAKELELPARDVVAALRAEGIKCASQSSTIAESDADILRRKLAAQKKSAPKTSAAKRDKRGGKTTASKVTAKAKGAPASSPKTPSKKTAPSPSAGKKLPKTVVKARPQVAAGTRATQKKSPTKKEVAPVPPPPPTPVVEPAKAAEAPPTPVSQPEQATKRSPVKNSGAALTLRPASAPALKPAPPKPASPPAVSAKPAAPPLPVPPRTAPSSTPRPPLESVSAPKPAPSPPPPAPPQDLKVLYLPEAVTVKDLAERMGVKSKDVLGSLLRRRVFAHINQTLDAKIAAAVAEEFGFLAETLSFEDMTAREQAEAAPKDEQGRQESRAPIVTVMGHVDHGKTKLLDVIRSTNVVEGEAGGITQHIGAYRVATRNPKDGSERTIVFLDTPGHEAFTRMRARGAGVTDIVVLVVAADDGVKPQTEEAISHAKAAKVPIVVAINKIDKPGADPQRVRTQLSERGLIPEEWGGDTVMVNVSALKKQGIDELLEMLALIADLRELRANPKARAAGTVIEANLDRRHGQVATVLIQNGTLHVGDPFIVGSAYGRVRALFDDAGKAIEEAGPATPVRVLGLNGLPEAGDRFQVVEDEKEARRVAMLRDEKERAAKLSVRHLTLDTLSSRIAKDGIEELPIILKCDVAGSLEVLSERLQALSTDKVKVKILHKALGAITEGDILLAETTGAIVLGFHVRPEAKAADLAERQGVEIRTFDVIYELTEAVEDAMLGLMKPVRKETVLGRAEVRQVFKISGVGAIAGCKVVSGSISRSAEVRLLRQNVVVYEGKISSLKRFKDDAREVQAGMECGIGIANFNDIKVGDSIEAYKEELVKPTKLQ